MDTCGMPWLSLKMMPICDGVMPFFAIFAIMSLISSGEVLHQSGADRLKGMDDLDIPFPLLCMRPMFASQCSVVFWKRRERKEVSILLFVTFFVAEDICTTHSPKKVFSLRTKIARPSSRRRCAQNTTTPGNDHNIRKGYVHNDTKTVASARSYLRISSNKTLILIAQQISLSLRKKRRVFSAQTRKKK